MLSRLYLYDFIFEIEIFLLGIQHCALDRCRFAPLRLIEIKCNNLFSYSNPRRRQEQIL